MPRPDWCVMARLALRARREPLRRVLTVLGEAAGGDSITREGSIVSVVYRRVRRVIAVQWQRRETRRARRCTTGTMGGFNT